jgi:hypothetical protein
MNAGDSSHTRTYAQHLTPLSIGQHDGSSRPDACEGVYQLAGVESLHRGRDARSITRPVKIEFDYMSWRRRLLRSRLISPGVSKDALMYAVTTRKTDVRLTAGIHHHGIPTTEMICE